MFIIRRNNKRYNNKRFDNYEAARKYVRRAITKLAGKYTDNISSAGFSITVVR